jgi:hypothetical protein
MGNIPWVCKCKAFSYWSILYSVKCHGKCIQLCSEDEALQMKAELEGIAFIIQAQLTDPFQREPFACMTVWSEES